MVEIHALSADVLGIAIDKTHTEDLDRVRQLDGRRWDAELKRWRVRPTAVVLRQLALFFPDARWFCKRPTALLPLPKPIAKSAKKHQRKGPKFLPEREQLMLDCEQQLILKAYAYITRKTYLHGLRHFLHRYPKDVDAKVFDAKQICAYLLEHITRDKWSKSRQNGIINAIQFLYERVLGYDRQKIDLPRPRKD